MQEKLFDIKPIRTKRPTFETIDLSNVYIEMAKDINEWDSCEMKGEQFEEFVEDLKEEFSYKDLINLDGYKLAKRLEDEMSFDSDSELVDVLSGVDFACYSELNKNIKEWVEKCSITPKYSIGQEVNVKIMNHQHIGEIVKINNHAEYTIYVEELGHVKDGQGTIGVIKSFEEIEDDFYDPKHWKD